ncbi:MAG TPA: LamG-like jellyroll fold domain-containing protein, partial [Gaiellaceae bacterium]|nr:LamG-like jellyroll fold domain-containing protein [Gaiellaceae bacterium]
MSGGDSSRYGFTGRAAFTLEMWAKPNTVDGTFRAHLRKGNSTDRWNVEVSSGYGFACHRRIGGANRGPSGFSDFKPVAGRYYHVVCTYDGTHIRLFVDGVPLGGAVLDDRSLPATSNPAQIGPNAISDIDEVAFYPAALSAARVVAHYRAGIGDLGQRRYHRFETFRLNDRTELKVNVATGNLLVQATDLRIAGRGLDLLVGRSYNGLSGDGRHLGLGWTLNTGGDVRLHAGP